MQCRIAIGWWYLLRSLPCHLLPSNYTWLHSLVVVLSRLEHFLCKFRQMSASKAYDIWVVFARNPQHVNVHRFSRFSRFRRFSLGQQSSYASVHLPSSASAREIGTISVPGTSTVWSAGSKLVMNMAKHTAQLILEIPAKTVQWIHTTSWGWLGACWKKSEKHLWSCCIKRWCTWILEVPSSKTSLRKHTTS
jgi:hypothetical protein